MHALDLTKQNLRFVLGGAAVAEEATLKTGAKKPIANETHEAEHA